jgi:threonine/homoserine/homoserine lactone efflux protein
MDLELFRVLLYVGFAAVFAWLCWRVFLSKDSATDPDGNKRPYTRRERILFIGFLLIGAAGFFFDPSPKAR